MLVTQPLLGIKRIFPLIKEHAPDCITVLPSFAALPRGTRLAIDATLWIQRLHFATDQHPDRHVFGFHRLIRQLRQHDLIPIMVFDNFGQQARLPAKTREHQRRRSQRCMLTLRAKIEEQRARRLYVLQRIVEHYKRLEPEGRGKISRLLSGWRDDEKAKHDQQRLGAVSYEGEFAWDEIASEKDRGDQAVLEYMDESLEDHDRELDALFPHIDSRVDVAGNDGGHDSMIWKDIDDSQLTHMPSIKGDETHQGLGMSRWDASMWSQVIQTESSEVLSLASQIRALRRQYALHVARANAGAAVSYGVMADWPKETQTQQQMTHSEGEVYRALEAGLSDPQLVSPTSEQRDVEEVEAVQGAEEEVAQEEEEDRLQVRNLVSDEESVLLEEDAEDAEQSPSGTSAPSTSATMDPTLLDDIDTLAQRNAHMQQYYVRSSTSLSQTAYESCATLCEMLNVPVLWTGSGNKGQGRPHEAEALASMLVRHGYADMVVSEDSDVILYDVPLLRGVMGAKKLELVDSSRVRKTLFPPQSALERLQRDKQPKGERTLADETDFSLEELKEDEVVDLDPVLLDAEQPVQSTVAPENVSSSDVAAEESDRSQADSASESLPPMEVEDAADRASRKQMLDFALLCGTDFNRTIPGIAASRAFRLIQEFGSIDGIRTEAVKRAVLDKRRAKRIAAAASVKRSARSAAGPASDPVGSSLISSLRNEAGLRTPDRLTWREYGKELTQARHVFEQPPTLFWQLRKVRDLKRDKQESLNAANLALAKVDRAAVKTFMRKRGAKDEEWDDDDGSHQPKESHGRAAGGWARRNGSRKAAATAVEGFGAKPFNDGGPVATWP